MLNVDAKSAGNKGNKIRVKGKCFGDDLSKIKIKVGGIDTTVKNKSKKKGHEFLSVSVDEGDSTPIPTNPDGSLKKGQFTNGCGIRRVHYRYNTYISAQTFRNQVIAGTSENTNHKVISMTDLEFVNTNLVNKADRMTAYFVPPRTGNYRFFISADDQA